ncbi:MAG TPA: hypothetical protein VHL50_03935 [Pyrinomonadaceae bacterium]|jgi:hypothetical protein|nr:hypothetical protein [Pyrinomonadaceae bacterium]
MMEGLPAYVSPFFIATTFLTVGFLFYAVKQAGTDSLPAKLLLFLIAFWLVFQASLALGGFFQVTSATPPRIFAFAAFPALLTAILFVVFFPRTLIDRLPLRTLTLLHVIRVPVEITLLWLFQSGQIPQAMTFEGRNLDILSGLSAPLIYFLAFRKRSPNRPLLIAWNIVALLLLANIVMIAVLTFPSPLQAMALDQPNRAVMYFPFNWLPAVVVPIVFFSHIASLRKLFTNSR